MDDNYIIITIGNRDYYIEASRLHDLAFINNKLVNISNTNITLVTDFDYNTTYPRITCSSMSACILRTSNNTNYTIVNQNYEYNNPFNMNILNNSNQNTILIGLLLILISIKLLWKK